jgi:hypothetical protein
MPKYDIDNHLQFIEKCEAILKNDDNWDKDNELASRHSFKYKTEPRFRIDTATTKEAMTRFVRWTQKSLDHMDWYWFPKKGPNRDYAWFRNNPPKNDDLLDLREERYFNWTDLFLHRDKK